MRHQSLKTVKMNGCSFQKFTSKFELVFVYDTIALRIVLAPFHNSNKKPQPYKTDAAANNFSSI